MLGETIKPASEIEAASNRIVSIVDANVKLNEEQSDHYQQFFHAEGIVDAPGDILHGASVKLERIVDEDGSGRFVEIKYAGKLLALFMQSDGESAKYKFDWGQSYDEVPPRHNETHDEEYLAAGASLANRLLDKVAFDGQRRLNPLD